MSIGAVSQDQLAAAMERLKRLFAPSAKTSREALRHRKRDLKKRLPHINQEQSVWVKDKVLQELPALADRADWVPTDRSDLRHKSFVALHPKIGPHAGLRTPHRPQPSRNERPDARRWSSLSQAKLGLLLSELSLSIPSFDVTS